MDSPIDRKADGVGPGSAVGREAREGATGYEVIMERALRAGRPSRGNGFSHRSEGGRGRARQRGRTGGAGGRRGVRGDHGACAQGRIPVRGNGPSNRRVPCASGERPVIMGCAAGPRTPGTARCDRGVRRRVRGDHGACAQGRMPVTQQRILESAGGRVPAGSGPVIIGCAVGPRCPVWGLVVHVELRGPALIGRTACEDAIHATDQRPSAMSRVFGLLRSAR